MSRFDEYLPALRQAAFARLRGKHPGLFPSRFVTGVEEYAVRPGAAMAKSLFDWHEYVTAHTTPDALAAMWPMTDQEDVDRFFAADSVARGEALGLVDDSINKMSLIAANLIDSDMCVLADGRSNCIIKSQPLATRDPKHRRLMNPALHEFTNEVIVSRMLNGLVTSFPHTVTPHFTTFLGCFATPDLLKHRSGEKDMRVYSVFERANKSVALLLKENLRSGDPLTAQRFGGICFQTASALAAGLAVAGVAHNDLHAGNVMVRDVTGTLYANRPWWYKLQDIPEYRSAPPGLHENNMVEIIDLGRATVTSETPDSHAAHARFLADVRVFLAAVAKVAEKNPVADPGISAYFAAMAAFVATMPGEYLDDPKMYIVAGKETSVQATKAWAAHFWTKWSTDDPTYGLGFLFNQFMPPTPATTVTWVEYIVDMVKVFIYRAPANTALKPVAVSIVPGPEETLASTNHEMAPTLRRLWKLQEPATEEPDGRRIRPRRRSFGACRTCASKPRFETADAHAHPFCGHHCYEVFTGLVDTI